MAKMSARTEFSCTPPIFDSQKSWSKPEMIDYSRKLGHHRTSFDEECRKIQYAADLAGNTDNADGRSLRDLIGEDMHILKPKNKILKAYQSCLCHSTSLIHEKPSTSAEVSLHRLAIAAPIGKVCTPNHRGELRAPEDFKGSDVLENHDCVDINLQQGQMSANTLLDHIFADSKFESNPFSQALEVLNLDKDLIIELLSEPNSLLKKSSRNIHSERETSSSISEAKHLCSSEACPTSQQSNKRATLKAELPNGKSLTSFSVREMKRKLKHTFGSRRRESNSNQEAKFTNSDKLSRKRSIFRQDCIYRGVEARSPLSSTTNAKEKKSLGRKQGLKVDREPHVAGETDIARRKIDVSRNRLCEKLGVGVSLDAKRDLPARVKDLNAIGRVISSHEFDSCLSPRRESLCFSCSAQLSFSTYRKRDCQNEMATTKKVSVTPYDCMTETESMETSSSLVPSTDEEEQDAKISPTQEMKLNDMPTVAEPNNITHSEADHDNNVQRAVEIKLHDKYGSLLHSIMDSVTLDNSPSSPRSVNQLDMRDNILNQDQEHRSPVSVLDQFFEEDCSSPSNTALQSGHHRLKPRCLHFEEHTLASYTQVTPIASNAWTQEQDYTISSYIRVIIQASSLDWDQLSAIRPLHEHLLHPSLVDQPQFLLSSPHFDTRLLFDHINEVLLETQRSLFVSPCWPALAKPRICCLPLEEAVIDEITKEAEFYLLPRTQKRTLDQLVAKDLSGSRLLKPDILPEIEQIIIHISEDILVESVMDVILQLHS